MAREKKGASHRLGNSVERPRRIAAVGLEVEPTEDVEHLAEDDAAARGGPDAVDVVAAECRVDRWSDLGLIGLQVVEGDEAAMLDHIARDELCGLAGVEVVRSRGGDPIQGAGEFGLDESVAGAPGRAVGLPNAATDSGKSPRRPKSPARWRHVSWV